MNFTIICASNDPVSLRKNLLASEFVAKCQVIIQRNYTNVQKAYNRACNIADGDILIFVHQDVFLPITFEKSLLESLDLLSTTSWGVIGPAGQAWDGGKGKILDRGITWGQDLVLPTVVNTLDELMLIVRKDTFYHSLYFDENIPNHHLIGADLCMQAISSGKRNFAINAYCAHRSKTRGFDPAFLDAAEYIMNKWPHFLPIHSTVADLYGPYVDGVKIRP
jgi:hypothetical protein